MPRANSIVSAKRVGNTLVVSVPEFADLVIDPSKVAAENRDNAMFHGFKARIVDAAAQSRDAVTGKPAPTADKYAAMAVLVDHYMSGATSWRLSGEPAGVSGDVAVLVEALMREKPTADRGELDGKVKALKPAQRTALLASDRLKSHVAAINAERSAGVDVDGLLGEII